MRRRDVIALLAGAALVRPPATRAQPAAGVHRLGYREGANLIVEYRSAEGQPERLGPLAMELMQTNPDVLVAGFGTLAAKAAKAATTTIPVVFTLVGDPLGAG